MFRFTANVWFAWRRESRFRASTPRGKKDLFSLLALVVILGAATMAVLTIGGILPPTVSAASGDADNAIHAWGEKEDSAQNGASQNSAHRDGAAVGSN
jgi:hypothetical protein